MNVLDICAGSGIGSLVVKGLGIGKTVCYVEWEPYCQKTIQQRIEDGWLDDAPIWDDLRTFDGQPWRGCVDLIMGGIPCQPWSSAGKRKGDADERDLWPTFIELVRNVGPSYVLVENVPDIKSKRNAQAGMGRMLHDLADLGYVIEWDVLSARGVGALHLRKRLWIVGYADSQGELQQEGLECQERGWAGDTGEEVSDPQCEGLERSSGERDKGEGRTGKQPPGSNPRRSGPWTDEPSVDRVAYGVASRMDRIKSIGNGWVPQVAAIPLSRIARLHEMRTFQSG